MVQYKACLKEWHKGTGGGSGLAIEFESWDKCKFEKYSVNPDDYDHTDISSRPPILMNLYAKQKQPYVTLIYLYDKKSNHLLSSRYDPIKIGMGEPGISCKTSNTNTSSITSPSVSTSNTKRKRQNPEKATAELADVMNTMMKFCTNDIKNSSNNSSTKDTSRVNHK